MTDIIFYWNFSDKKFVDKQLHTIITLNGVYKTPFDFANPTVYIDRAASTFPNAFPNYCKLNNNYYFILDWEVATTQYWKFTAHIDVLMTYKEQIRNSFAVISRQQYIHNAYLNDPLTQTLQKTNISTIGMGGATLHPTFCLVTTGGGSGGSGGGSSE